MKNKFFIKKSILSLLALVLICGGFLGSWLAVEAAATTPSEPSMVLAQATGAGGLVPCGGTNEDLCDMDDVLTIVGNFINFVLLFIAMPLAACVLMYAGFLMMTAAGNMSKIEEAKKIFKYVLIGLIVAFAAWLMVEALMKGLSVKDEFWLLEQT